MAKANVDVDVLDGNAAVPSTEKARRGLARGTASQSLRGIICLARSGASRGGGLLSGRTRLVAANARYPGFGL